MGVTSCISNYNPNGYNNNERCTFIVNRDINVFSTEFNTEGYFDQLVVNGKAYAELIAFMSCQSLSKIFLFAVMTIAPISYLVSVRTDHSLPSSLALCYKASCFNHSHSGDEYFFTCPSTGFNTIITFALPVDSPCIHARSRT